jgi:hypothetical protein
MKKYYPKETVKSFNQMLEDFRVSRNKKIKLPKGWYSIAK